MLLVIFLFAIVHSSHKIIDVNRKTFAISEFLEILQVGVSITCTFNGNFNAECAVRPPNNVAAIPQDASAKAIFCSDRIAK